MTFTNPIAKAYAKSLFSNVLSNEKKISLTDKNNVKNPPKISFIGEELLFLRGFFIASQELNNHFKNPTIPETEKADILFSLLPGLTSSTKAFLRILTERNHLALIPQISEEYNSILFRLKKACKVKLIISTSLNESFGKKLLKSLKNITGCEEIILSFVYNPNLLGGFILEYNSTNIDASTLKELSFFFNEI